MDSQLLDRFVQLLAAQTGIVTREPDRLMLAKKIRARMSVLDLERPEHYYAMLKPSASGTLTVAQTQEWQALAMRITTGESYFFRDRGQFNLLETELLPAAIAARRRQQAEKNLARPTLKIWSAGCSTGEELYSLAILLVKLIPDWERWDLQLTGTDINLEFLQAARQGGYSDWSFRQVLPEMRSRFFQPTTRKQWRISPNIRKLARFRYGNLLADDFRQPIFQDCDLIVCRNVFIYFSTAAISRVLEKFKANLRPGGHLLCGHTELHDCNTEGLTAQMFPASMVYQREAINSTDVGAIAPTIRKSTTTPWQPRPSDSSPLTTPAWAPFKLAKTPILSPVAVSESPAVATLPARSLTIASPGELAAPAAKNLVRAAKPEATWEQAEALFEAGETEAALAIAERLPPTFATLLAIAGARADRGQLDRAEGAALEAKQQAPEAIAPIQILAHIAEERGDLALAKRYWRQAVYLKPEAIAPYLELAAILQREGNAMGAQKQRAIARELLEARLPSESIDCGRGRPERTASWLLRYLGQELAIAS